jgi:hypothetical protein
LVAGDPLLVFLEIAAILADAGPYGPKAVPDHPRRFSRRFLSLHMLLHHK